MPLILITKNPEYKHKKLAIYTACNLLITVLCTFVYIFIQGHVYLIPQWFFTTWFYTAFRFVG